MTKELSIIMLAYNQPELEKQTMQNLMKTTNPNTTEYIVVFQQPNPELQEYFNTFGIQCIINDKNVGIPAGWNQGARKATGKYLCFANSDILCPTDWFPRLKKGLDKYAVGVVGPCTSHAHNVQKVVDFDDNTKITFEDVELQDKGFQKKYSEDDIEEIDYVNGFFFLTTKRIFYKVGYFDEDFKEGFYEEYDWNVRAQKERLKTVWVKNVFVHHIGKQTFNKMDKDEGFNQGKKRLESYNLFIKKHGKDLEIMCTNEYKWAKNADKVFISVNKHDEALRVIKEEYKKLKLGQSIRWTHHLPQMVFQQQTYNEESLQPWLDEFCKEYYFYRINKETNGDYPKNVLGVEMIRR